MTSNDVAELKVWISEQLVEAKALLKAHGDRLDDIERRVATMDATYASVERLDHLADALETVTNIVTKGKRFWLSFAGLITATLVVIDLIARAIPNLPWP